MTTHDDFEDHDEQPKRKLERRKLDAREEDEPQDVGAPPAYPLEMEIESILSGDVTSEMAPAPGFDDPPEGPEDAPPDNLGKMIEGLPRWQQKVVLGLIDAQGVLAIAARNAKCSCSSIARHRKQSPRFDEAMIEAEHICRGLYKAALVKMGVIGELTPVFQGGIKVGHKRVKDVRALEILNKAANPEEFGDNAKTDIVKTIQDGEAAKAALMDAAKRLFGARKAVDVRRERSLKGREI